METPATESDQETAPPPGDAAAKSTPLSAPARVAWWSKRLGLLFASLLLVCILVEVGVTLTKGPQVRFPRHVVEAPWAIRYNKPGARYTHRSADGTWQFRINDQGMRSDRNYAYEKPPGVKRIVSLGDSFTVGYECNVEECFSTLLEGELSEKGHTVEVLNGGVSGFSTAEEYAYLVRELIKYSPDVVVISFWANDLGDNVRTKMFTLDASGALKRGAYGYVPAGELGNFLNRSRVFGWLTSRSNAFAYLKERATLATKRKAHSRGRANTSTTLAEVDAAIARKSDQPKVDYAALLTAGIYDRLYAFLKEREIPLVVQTIPYADPAIGGELNDWFPFEHFDSDRPGLHFLRMKEVLQPRMGEVQLYWKRSHNHWTPPAHKLSAEALARLIDSEGLLGSP